MKGGRTRVRQRLGMAAAGVWIALAAAPSPRAGSDDQGVSPIWRVAGEGRGTPAADDTTAYFLSKRHEVLAIDLATGLVRWRARTLGTGAETIGARVLRVGEVIVAGDYDLVGFDRRTGGIRWRFAPRAGYGAGIHLGQASGDQVFAGSAGGHLHAIDARSGRARWSVEIANDGQDTTVFGPVARGDVVVAAFTVHSRPARGGVVALERGTGLERWRRRFPAWLTTGAATGAAGEPLLLDELVIASSQEGTIIGFDRATGVVRWVIPAGARPDGRGMVVQDFRPLVLVGRLLVAGSLTGTIVAYDVETRRERWRRAPVAASVACGLAADEDTVYVPYLSGDLVAMDAESGAERWRAGGRGMGLSWPPLVAPARLLAAGSGAGFLAFPR